MKNSLYRSVSLAPLLSLRLGFGLVLLYAVLWSWLYKGDLQERYLQPEFLFKYPGFSWLLPLPDLLMYAMYPLLLLSALGIFLGLYYRVSVFVFGLLFSYLHLLDSTNYINHYYLISLLCFLLFFMPAHRIYSLDISLGRVSAAALMPAWSLWLLRFQLAVVYVFAGLAKLNFDWLLEAMPLKIWLLQQSEFPLLGIFFQQTWLHYAMSWGGALFDLCIVFFLLNKHSRPWAYALLCVFHILTGLLFDIGVFPHVMIASTLVFFSPEQHEAFWQKWARRQGGGEVLKSSMPKFFWLYIALQLILPLRAYLYSNRGTWGEEGYRWGWRVMLVEKEGQAIFYIKEQGGQQRQWIDDEQALLSPYQKKRMTPQAQHLRQYARYLAESYQKQYGLSTLPVVSARVYLSYNNQPSQLLLHPDCNLVEELPFWASDPCIRGRE